MDSFQEFHLSMFKEILYYETEVMTATQVLPLHFAKKRSKCNNKRSGFCLFPCSSKLILLFTNFGQAHFIMYYKFIII